ncbi:hypothetical protein [Halocynthiibacter namhaensis]|uniref:hypothetical protein n=1 Tax=Halocynthiibacter namhaensis TaxID=1290553 RepID=UPI000579368A|nr:hypothetical protein [Halocynthiibacter namhaensis]
MIQVDNFLPFYDAIMTRSKHFAYFTDAQEHEMDGPSFQFRGVRTTNLVPMMNVLRHHLEVQLRINLANMYFHKHTPMPDVMPRLHRDGGFQTAGVIYLTGGPGCGTFVDEQLVEFKENRLTCYSSQTLHRPEGFPMDRMVLTFFSYDEPPSLASNV